MDQDDPRGPGPGMGGTDPHPGPTRRFTLADLLILVAAAGVALMVLILHLRQEERADIDRSRPPTVVVTFTQWILGLLPFLVMAAFALLLMRFRRPRPSRRRVFRQPG